ncbi:hypothetical protein GCM10025861_11480 [Methanobacterium petrolearium]|nr:hypothetical protein GCM10025861_11480 [Methanobacterium petrolearium]
MKNPFNNKAPIPTVKTMNGSNTRASMGQNKTLNSPTNPATIKAVLQSSKLKPTDKWSMIIKAKNPLSTL